MQSEGFLFEEKPVFDWNHKPVGTVSTARRDPKTRAATQIVLALSADAKAELGVEDDNLELPASIVFGMRRDSVTLDRSISELKRIEFFSSIIKK